MAVTVKRLTVGPIEENCYIVYDEEQACKTCFLIDPGASGAKIVNALKALGRTPEAILLTHGHFDHIMAVDWVKKEFPSITVYAYEEEKTVLEDPDVSMLGQFGEAQGLKDVEYLKADAFKNFADIPVKLLATPGHTCGSCCYYLEKEAVLFSGDTLFLESVGRTDFPTGNDKKLRESIFEKLKVLPDETKVYPGHGEETTIGHEKKFNFIMLGF